MEIPLYRELWFLSGTKLSKRAKKMLKTTLILEDQSRQQMIKMWKWCEPWWRKTTEWVSGWLQKKQAWIKLRKWVQQVRTDIADDWVLHHDNAPADTVLSIRGFLAKKNIPVLLHPPYSPDPAPCNFCPFSKLKSKLKVHHFGTMENVQKVVTDELHTLTENDFRCCYDQWKKNIGTTV